MSTLHQIHEGLYEALGAVTDGWQYLYQRAEDAR